MCSEQNLKSYFKARKLEFFFFFHRKDTGAALTFFAYEKNENISKKVFQNEKPHSSILKKPFKQARIAF